MQHRMKFVEIYMHNSIQYARRRVILGLSLMKRVWPRVDVARGMAPYAYLIYARGLTSAVACRSSTPMI